MHIDYSADYICPWCYLALDRVEWLAAEHGAVVTWHPYELHPEIPGSGGQAPAIRRAPDVDAYLRAELAAAELAVAPRRTWSNSRRALALSAWAQPLAAWPDLHRGLYRAYWAEGRDIGDPDVLADVATAAGIDAGDALAEAWGTDRLVASKDRAIDLGIAATPGWHFGGGVVVAGAQPRRVFDKVLHRLQGVAS